MLAFHIDLNSVALKRETISSLLHFLAACGYDSILWEVEDKIRWETCPECVHPDAFTKDEFRDILDEAVALGLQPIPLLQTFGHGEYVLACEKYVPWRLARRHFGDVSAQTLCDLTDWDHGNFAGIEGRGWTRYKDASVPTPGRWAAVMADADGKPEGEPGSRPSRITATEAMLAKMKAAEATLRAARHRTALADLLARGAELNIRLLEDSPAAVRGELVPPAPCLAAADYYGLEQTDLSAMTFARLVWAVMDERFAEVSPLRK